MRPFKGICSKTNKVETIYCETISCFTQDNPEDFAPGIMYACSVDPSGRNLCSDCPIYKAFVQLNCK